MAHNLVEASGSFIGIIVTLLKQIVVDYIDFWYYWICSWRTVVPLCAIISAALTVHAAKVILRELQQQQQHPNNNVLRRVMRSLNNRRRDNL